MDLKFATRLLAAVHGCYGLGDRLTSRGDYDTAETLLTYDPELAALVEAELGRLMASARDHVTRHTVAIQALARKLLEHRIASPEDVVAPFEVGVRDRQMRLLRNSGSGPGGVSKPGRPDPG